ncbi:hypothetical protein GE300_14765 [Rhodobacteraceae bacterium 2CG4]|uniref:Calcineurin-like phosphoesterase domain-containing protein n=1 Tax=Halovulum marinum TaxID=2662447 RepID=A0A6L5Z2S0_9RHOB|nr:metallophosphoesterase [Halovulum marinum]MSU90863.1 hypothetical protein [Halovulum marinum]
MVKFLYWSDLHREFGSSDHPVPFPEPTRDVNLTNIDAILIAGDLHAGDEHVSSLVEIEERWGVPVISTRGNHAFYHDDFASLPGRHARLAAEARTQGRRVHVLDRETLVLGDTRILGATLWADFEVLRPNPDRLEATMYGARHLMNDYRKVLAEPDGDLLMPSATAAQHRADRAWLAQELAKPWDGRTLVMTHHIPVPEALAPEAGKGEMAPAYVSDLRHDMLRFPIDAWVSGHSHWARRGTLPGLHGPVAFTANMQGYPGQHTNFDPYLVLDMDAPTLGLEPIGIADPSLRDLPGAEEVLEEIRAEVPAEGGSRPGAPMP